MTDIVLVCKMVMQEITKIEDTLEDYIYGNYYFEYALYRHRIDGVLD